MSLDVSLVRERWISHDKGLTHRVDNEVLFTANITHNLTKMAEKAGIYEALWRPYQLLPTFIKGTDNEEWEFECNNVVLAKDIIPVLEAGLKSLISKPKYYEKFDSSNGWGMYKHFVPFVSKYLTACKEFPDSIIKTDR